MRSSIQAIAALGLWLAMPEPVGAGPKTIYIAVKDEDDVIRLHRHPW